MIRLKTKFLFDQTYELKLEYYSIKAMHHFFIKVQFDWLILEPGAKLGQIRLLDGVFLN